VLSITECKKQLNKNGISYNNEEIEKLRIALYQLAEIMYNQKK